MNWLGAMIHVMQRSPESDWDLRSLYNEVPKLRAEPLPDHYDSVIRALLYAHSTDAAAYKPGNPDLFSKGQRRGTWRLRSDWEDRLIERAFVAKNDAYLQDWAFAQCTVEDLHQCLGDVARLPGLLRSKIEAKREELIAKGRLPLGGH